MLIMTCGTPKLLLLLAVVVFPCFVFAQDENYLVTLMFPIFGLEPGQKLRCSPERNLDGMVIFEGVLYALNQINNHSNLLPNVTLQQRLLNHCGSEERAVSAFGQAFAAMDDDPLVLAVITAGLHSDFAKTASSLLKINDHHIPVISLDSETSSGDSDVFRMVPDKDTTNMAIVDVMQHFNWNYVIVISSDDEEGKKRVKSFKDKVEKNGFCIFKVYYVADVNSVEDSMTIIQDEVIDGNLHVIVLLTPRELSYVITNETVRLGMGDLVWFGTEDSWDKSIAVPDHHFPYIGGLMFLEHYSGTNVDDFKTYLRNLDQTKHPSNPYFLESHKVELVNRADKAVPVIDAIFAIAHMLKQKKACTGKECDKSYSEIFSGLNFHSPTGHRVSFNDNKEISATSFSLNNLQKNPSPVGSKDVGMLKFRSVGKWTKNGTKPILHISDKDIVWNSGDDVPKSQCNDQCKPGWFVQPKFDPNAPPCCFDCIPCKPGTVSFTENAKFCQECPEGYYTKDSKKCIPQELEYIHWDEAEALVMIFLIVALACVLIYAMFILDKNARTPVVHNSTNATMGLLFTIFINTFLPLVIFFKPSEDSCCAFAIYYVIGIGLPIAVLLAKCKYIRDTFYDEEGNRKAMCGPCSPTLAVFLFFLALHIIIVLVYTKFYPGEVLMFDTDRKDTVYIECSTFSQGHFLILFFYITFLSLLLTVFSATSLEMDDDLRESKWVCYCIFNFYVLVFFYIIASYGLDPGKGKVAAIAYIVFLFPLNFFACIFCPKLYVIIFHPENNRPDASPLLLHEKTQAKISERLSFQKPPVNQSPLLPRVSREERDTEKEDSATPV